MSDHEDSVYLLHIIQCIDRIEEYTKGKTAHDFSKSTITQDAVIRQLEVIGEAVNHLSKRITNRYVHIGWRDIIGMRNKLIHDYLGVDTELVWITVENDIPFLKSEIQKILDTEFK